MLSQSVQVAESGGVSHNTMGQRLGRKGQETRERILGAFERMLARPSQNQITLSNVAREAAVGMSTLYLYFPDLGALVLAGLQRIMDRAEIAFLETLRSRWSDPELGEKCLQFTRQYYEFWRRHGRILHLRNSLADSNDARFLESRHRTTMPMVRMLVRQMDADFKDKDGFPTHFAMVLLTSVERICTVVTNPYFPFRDGGDTTPVPDHAGKLIIAEACLIEIGLRHQRQIQRTQKT